MSKTNQLKRHLEDRDNVSIDKDESTTACFDSKLYYTGIEFVSKENGQNENSANFPKQ